MSIQEYQSLIWLLKFFMIWNFLLTVGLLFLAIVLFNLYIQITREPWVRCDGGGNA